MADQRHPDLEHWYSDRPQFGGQWNTKETDQSPFSQRMAWTGRTAKLQSPSYKQWFNPNVFSMPVSFAIGNAPRALANVNNRSYTNLDLQLAKNTEIAEGYKVQIRLEMFNALNHSSPGSLNTGLNFGHFGQISSYYTGSGGSRRLQLAAKFNF